MDFKSLRQQRNDVRIPTLGEMSHHAEGRIAQRLEIHRRKNGEREFLSVACIQSDMEISARLDFRFDENDAVADSAFPESTFWPQKLVTV